MISLSQSQAPNSLAFEDTVANICWSPTTPREFACTSWDSKVTLVEILESESSQALIRQKFSKTVEYPCLSVGWLHQTNNLIAGSINGDVNKIDGEREALMRIGSHEDAVKGVYSPANNCILSLAYDKKLKIWDPRQSTAVGTLSLGLKPTCASFLFPHLAIGFDNHAVGIFDLTDFRAFENPKPENYADLRLTINDAQLSSISISKEGVIFIGSHSGTSNISTFTRGPDGKVTLNHHLSYRIHKLDPGQGGNTSNLRMQYSVNVVGLHPTMRDVGFTAGRDGGICFINFERKLWLGKISCTPVPIAEAKLSPDGKYLAYAAGYDWSIGIEGAKSYKSQLKVECLERSNGETHPVFISRRVENR